MHYYYILLQDENKVREEEEREREGTEEKLGVSMVLFNILLIWYHQNMNKKKNFKNKFNELILFLTKYYILIEIALLE